MERITIYPEDDPAQLARKFCEAKEFDEETEQILV